MRRSVRISFVDKIRKRRLFIYTLLGLAAVFVFDLLMILSFDSLPRDLAALVDSQEIYVIFEEWYSYIGHFFSVCFFLILLACMCAVCLMNAWDNKLQPIPILLTWCSSLGILSSLGQVGKLLSATRPHIFSEVAEGLNQLSILPLLLCLVYYMRRYHKLYIPFVLLNCFSSAALLVSLAWDSQQRFVPVLKMVSDGLFVVCFVIGIFACVLEWKNKNVLFRSFIPSLLISAMIVIIFHVVVVLIKNGFSVARLRIYLGSLSFSLNWIRLNLLDPIVFFGTTLLIVVNYLRQYHQHILQLQTLRSRDEANLEYAQNLRRYEDSVRKIKHDISNTINVATMLCKNGEYEQLQEYLGNMTDFVASVRTELYCRHILANYLLLMFEARFRDAGADFRCKATLPPSLDIQDTDIASELNNILQNALDAVMELPLEQRWVEIVLRMEKNVVRIDCRNPYAKEPAVSENGLFHSSKGDGTGHGLGMQIIYDIAEKYGGVAVPFYSNGVFEIKVALPVGNGD